MILHRLSLSRVARTALALVAAVGLFLPGAAVSVAAPDDTPGTTSTAPGQVEPNVIGGTPPTHDYPAGAYVSLKYDVESVVDGWHTCGGRLTFNRTVLTAAHCVTDMPAGLSVEQRAALARQYKIDPQTAAIPVEKKHFWVRIGSPHKDVGGVIARVTAITVHQDWDWMTTDGAAADLAELKLDSYVDVYTLPIAPREARPGDVVFRLGWGFTEPDSTGPVPSQIRQLSSLILQPAACLPTHPFGHRVGDVCVNNPHGVDGACYGDSGGPIVILIDGVWYDAGITSRSVSDYCGVAPDSYTSTAHYRKWVYDNARGLPVKAQPEPEMGLPYERPMSISLPPLPTPGHTRPVLLPA